MPTHLLGTFPLQYMLQTAFSSCLLAVCSVSQGTCCVQWGDVGMKTVRGFPYTADISRETPSKVSRRCCGMHTCRAWLKKIIIRRWRWHVNVNWSCSSRDTVYLGLLGQHGNWYMEWLRLGGLRKWKRCLWGVQRGSGHEGEWSSQQDWQWQEVVNIRIVHLAGNKLFALSMRKFRHLTVYRSNPDRYFWRTLIESSRSRWHRSCSSFSFHCTHMHKWERARCDGKPHFLHNHMLHMLLSNLHSLQSTLRESTTWVHDWEGT